MQLFRFIGPLLLVVEVVSHQRVDDLGDVAPLFYAMDFQGFLVLVSQVDLDRLDVTEATATRDAATRPHRESGVSP